jgi:hypothetical protein
MKITLLPARRRPERVTDLFPQYSIEISSNQMDNHMIRIYRQRSHKGLFRNVHQKGL